MADERKCYAGDLTSDAIGKTIRFEHGEPNRRTIYTDVLTSVTHARERSNGTSYPAEFKKVTTIYLGGTQWTIRGSGVFGLPTFTDQGLKLDDTHLIEVL